MLIVGAFDMQKEIFKRSGTTPKRAGLLNVSDMFGKAIVDAFKARFSELAMPYELVGAVTYEPDLVELPRGVAKAKELNIDLFMPLCRGPDAKIIIQEMVKQDWQPLGIITPASPGLYDQDFLKSMGKNADYHISTLPWLDPKSAMTESLRKHHAARFPGAQLDINGGFTFEAMLVAAHGWLAARSTRGDSLIDALRKVKIDQHVITGGPIQFDEKGQNTNITTAAVQNLNRTPTIVLPDEWATAKLVFPEPGWKDPRRT
jgi:branched-chain amino acid transport system substrate-binding protein